MKKHKSGTWYLFHKKSNSWRIFSEFYRMNISGGGPLEIKRFKTEQELINYLDKGEN